MPYYRFTGKELDPETGLYYYGARYYDPVLSRWISADPMVVKYLPDLLDPRQQKRDWIPEQDLPGEGGIYNPLNLDLYGYVGNNPLNFVDPLGLAKIQEKEIGGYVFRKVPGDLFHGGEHWHVYKRGKLLGRVSVTGEVLTGAIPKTALKKARKAGLIGMLLTAYTLYQAATADDAKAFENILEMIQDFPEEKQKKIIEEMMKNRPDFFEKMPDPKKGSEPKAANPKEPDSKGTDSKGSDKSMDSSNSNGKKQNVGSEIECKACH